MGDVRVCETKRGPAPIEPARRTHIERTTAAHDADGDEDARQALHARYMLHDALMIYQPLRAAHTP
jgi:hypothetical protein